MVQLSRRGLGIEASQRWGPGRLVIGFAKKKTKQNHMILLAFLHCTCIWITSGKH